MTTMADKLLVRLMPELKDLIAEKAESLGIYGGMGELAVKILAEYFNRPDLSRVPRQRVGRPRKKRATARTAKAG